MTSISICVRVHRNRGDAQTLRRVRNAAYNFAAVGDQ
jgi:hypothetical protein